MSSGRPDGLDSVPYPTILENRNFFLLLLFYHKTTPQDLLLQKLFTHHSENTPTSTLIFRTRSIDPGFWIS